MPAPWISKHFGYISNTSLHIPTQAAWTQCTQFSIVPMPQAKTIRRWLKTVSCPRCSKKFYTETNVLQHMNQPTGPCYHGSLPLFNEQGILVAHAFGAPDSHSADQGEFKSPESTGILDKDIEMNELASNTSGDPPVFDPEPS